MLVVYFLLSLFYINCESEDIFSYEEKLQERGLILCITEILEKYFSEEKSLTYVDMGSDNEEILKNIHSMKIIALLFRKATEKQHFRHQAYFIIAKNAKKFTENFKYLIQEMMWNPFARFIIVIESLKDDELRIVFDELLKHLVINVIVINGTKDAEIYTYNPYENYGCGKYYNRIISYGVCSKKHGNLFPYKLVRGLRNCTLNAAVGDHAPYTFFPPKSIKHPGTEHYIFKILSEIEEFNVNYRFVPAKGMFTTIDENMKVTGPMEVLQNNETDVMFGAKLLVSSRADAFTYLHGHLDYDDELNFLVKRASLTAIWKSSYLEFQPLVWCLLLIVFLLYTTIMALLLRADDKSVIILKLLNSLLLHSFKIPERTTAKFFFIIWVWFAYLMNSIYQSSLVSLTSNPIMDYQISNEQDLGTHELKACLSNSYLVYIYSEMNVSATHNTECINNLENIKMIAQSGDMFTLTQKSVYKYYKKTYCDEFGDSPVYAFKVPHAKLIFGYFFRKGFPIPDRMRKNVIRMRETGLVAKNLKDHYYMRKIKNHFHKKGFVTRFVVPWRIFVIGCVISSVVFVFELFWERYKK